MGKGHPECAERLEAIKDRLMAAGIWDFLLHIEAPAATRTIGAGAWLGLSR
jgi:hypothetical protein